MHVFIIWMGLVATLIHGPEGTEKATALVRSAASGRWGDPATWEGGQIPAAGTRVQVRTGHEVIYDASSDAPIRSIHVAGTLSFDPDRDTRLTVGLIKIQAGDDASETGFDCEARSGHMDFEKGPRPALLVGRPERPIPAGHTATIRLAKVDGLDPEECPAIVCCGARMEFHGAPLERTWIKLGATAAAGDRELTLAGPVEGWRPGDRVIVTATAIPRIKGVRAIPTVAEWSQTEERTIARVEGTRVTLDKPLQYDHAGTGEFRGEVALLSRNVVVESADPAAARGHTMYHHGSSGSISYAEFRHLGKVGKLGKYSLHFHKAADTMRGSSVIGASIWDSGNRWITIHGTNDLVVRDCVGYRAVGHGFFLEDGTEVDNILDRNLAVHALAGQRLPGQALAFDPNDGAGFWWANSRNAFTRNVAVECEGYGFRLDAPATKGFDPVMPVRGADGVRRPTDIRTEPFLRFQANEAHSQRRYGLNLGGGHGEGETGGVGGVGPESQRPSLVRDLKVWQSLWAFTPAIPGLLVDRCTIESCEFGIWRPVYDRQAYRDVSIHTTRWAHMAETGDRLAVMDYPGPLNPTDARPPVTVITHAWRDGTGHVQVRGTAVDDGTVRRVEVNGLPARAETTGFLTWVVTLDGPRSGTVVLRACATDAAGNTELRPHEVTVSDR